MNISIKITDSSNRTAGEFLRRTTSQPPETESSHTATVSNAGPFKLGSRGVDGQKEYDEHCFKGVPIADVMQVEVESAGFLDAFVVADVVHGLGYGFEYQSVVLFPAKRRINW